MMERGCGGLRPDAGGLRPDAGEGLRMPHRGLRPDTLVRYRGLVNDVFQLSLGLVKMLDR